MFTAANDHIVDVEHSPCSITSSSEYASSYSSDEGFFRRSVSAVGDKVGVESGPKNRKHRTASRPTMRIPLHGDIAAVGASGGSASVAATCGSTRSPFEEESQEGQLEGSLRAACRQHVREGGEPPIASSVIFGPLQAANSRDDEPRTRSKAPLRPAEAELPAVGGESAVGGRLRTPKAVPREKAAARPPSPTVGGESAVGGRPAVGRESAVIGDSAVRGEGTRVKANVLPRTVAPKTDIGAFFSEGEGRGFNDFSIFKDTSPLWRAVAAETRKKGCVIGSGQIAGEHVFCLLNVNSPETTGTELDRNFKVWMNGMKQWLLQRPDFWKKMLEDVPGRPSASDKAGKIPPSSPANDMAGMLSKFNWEYRRPSPTDNAFLDSWSKSRQGITSDMLETFLHSGDFNIERNELRHTYPWAKKDVDWTEWGVGNGVDYCAWTGSSMLVPISLNDSAVGERTYYQRSVTTICFPAFCFLLGQKFTAAEIGDAWMQLPLVKGGKKTVVRTLAPARGRASGLGEGRPSATKSMHNEQGLAERMVRAN